MMANTRLLLVEDDRALADLVTFHFERAGYGVTRTGDGEEALILVDEVKPDIILLDWMIEESAGLRCAAGSVADRPAKTRRSSSSPRAAGRATGFAASRLAPTIM
jgi:DNA-binding response OmpR family regulator